MPPRIVHFVDDRQAVEMVRNRETAARIGRDFGKVGVRYSNRISSVRTNISMNSISTNATCHRRPTHLHGFGGTAEMMATLGCFRGGIRRTCCGLARHLSMIMFAKLHADVPDTQETWVCCQKLDTSGVNTLPGARSAATVTRSPMQVMVLELTNAHLPTRLRQHLQELQQWSACGPAACGGRQWHRFWLSPSRRRCLLRPCCPHPQPAQHSLHRVAVRELPCLQ